MVASDPLRREIVLRHMAEALPFHEDDSNNESHLSSSHEVIALLCHACMVATGYSLLPPQSSPRLPANWNSTYGRYSFTYQRAVSSGQIVLRVCREGGNDKITATTTKSKESFEMETEKLVLYITRSSLPLRLPVESNGTRHVKDVCVKIAHIFHEGALERLVESFRQSIIIAIANAEPASDNTGAAIADDQNQIRQEAFRDEGKGDLETPSDLRPNLDPRPEPAKPKPFDDLLQPVPRRPVPAGDFPPPDFEDEYEMNRGPRGGIPLPGRAPLNIGHDDLNPPGLGPHDPFRPSFIGGPHRGGGGMHPTFDDPLFRGDQPSGTYDLRVPPGARYDPTGPGDTAGSRRPQGLSNPSGDQPGAGTGGFGGPPFGGLEGPDDMMPRPPGGFQPPFGRGPRGGFGGGFGSGFGSGDII